MRRVEIIHHKYGLLLEKKPKSVDLHCDRLQPAALLAFASGVFTCSLLQGIIIEEDRPLNAYTTNSGERIRFEVVINTQTEDACRDQDEAPDRHSSMLPPHPRKIVSLPFPR